MLIAKRPEHKHQGGLWEFPGGKLETDEPVEEALKRELHEELGIEIQQAHPLVRIHHDYPDKSVLLDVWKVTAFSGEAHGKEGQPVEWVKSEELDQFDFPEANKPIIKAAQLPDRYLITGEYSSLEEAKAHIKKRIQQGIRLIQFRAHYLSNEDYLLWAGELDDLCQGFDCKLILNCDRTLLEKVSFAGLHLSSARLMRCGSRPVANDILLSASVHNIEELKQAELMSVDFIVVAPVLKTQTHLDANPLGWEKFYEITEKATMPVYALGGMGIENLSTAQQYGGQGIAAIRGLYDE